MTQNSQNNKKWKDPADWSDLSKSWRWVLRIIILSFLAILIYLPISSFSSEPVAVINEPASTVNTTTYLYTHVIGINFKRVIDAKWINEDEILIIGENIISIESADPTYGLEVFNIKTKDWNVLPTLDVRALCPDLDTIKYLMDLNQISLLNLPDGRIGISGKCGVYASGELFAAEIKLDEDGALRLILNPFTDSQTNDVIGWSISPTEKQQFYVSLENDGMFVSVKEDSQNTTKIVMKKTDLIVKQSVWSPDSKIILFQGGIRANEDFLYLVKTEEWNETKEYEKYPHVIENLNNLEWKGGLITFSGQFQGMEGGWTLDLKENELCFYDLSNFQSTPHNPDANISFSPSYKKVLSVIPSDENRQGAALRIIEFQTCTAVGDS